MVETLDVHELTSRAVLRSLAVAGSTVTVTDMSSVLTHETDEKNKLVMDFSASISN